MTDSPPNNTAKSAAPGYAPKDEAVKSILVQDEKVLVQGRIHPAIYWKGIAVLIFALLLALKVPVLGALFGFVGAIMLAMAVVTKHFLMLALTNKRVLTRYGILQVDIVAIPFHKIESLETKRMLPGHIFGYANVVVMGTGQRYVNIPFIANAVEFRRKYDEVTLKQSEKAAGTE